MKGIGVCLAALLLVVPSLCSASSQCDPLSQEDASAVRALLDAYRTSWLKGDAEGVLKTFTSDAVLLPAHGARAIVGKDAIMRYWWPAGAPPSKITKLDISLEQLGGDCAIAFSYGRDDVAWTQDEQGALKTYGHPGTYLNVFHKQPDGSWRISHHMWDDDPSEK